MIDDIRLFWTDLETTGLNPDAGEILEVGCVVTDRHFTELAVHHEVVGHDMDHLAPLMDAWVTKTHGESGLIAECQAVRELAAGRDLVADAMANLKEFMVANMKSSMPGNNYMAGSSVHFDARWLRAKGFDMRLLSYRLLDVSALMVASECITGQAMPKKAKPAHRVLADIADSLVLMKHFARHGLAYAGQP